MKSAEIPRRARRRAGRLASAGVIMEAATTLFLRNGYLGTSMDEIAALAGVSKQTVYTHFADKEQLFKELVLSNASRAEGFLHGLVGRFDETRNLEQDLRTFARDYIGFVIQPQVLQLRRLIIGEAGRFPELARTYYEQVPQRVIETLGARLESLAQRGLLRIEDPHLAASHLAWLVLTIPMDEAMFRGGEAHLTPGELERIADAGVRVFLAAYGPEA